MRLFFCLALLVAASDAQASPFSEQGQYGQQPSFSGQGQYNPDPFGRQAQYNPAPIRQAQYNSAPIAQYNQAPSIEESQSDPAQLSEQSQYSQGPGSESSSSGSAPISAPAAPVSPKAALDAAVAACNRDANAGQQPFGVSCDLQNVRRLRAAVQATRLQSMGRGGNAQAIQATQARPPLAPAAARPIPRFGYARQAPRPQPPPRRVAPAPRRPLRFAYNRQ